MKPWLVVVFERGPNYNFRRGDAGRRTTGMAMVVPQETCHWNGDPEKNNRVYGMDSKEDAENFILHLTEMFPMHTCLLCETKSVSYRPLGERMQASFSDAGLLPI